MIRFACPSCNAAFTVPEEKAGHKATCPRCRQRILIPAPLRNVTVLGKLLPPKEAPEPPAATPREASYLVAPPPQWTPPEPPQPPAPPPAFTAAPPPPI